MRSAARRTSAALSFTSVAALSVTLFVAPQATGQDNGPILDPLPDPTPSNLALTLEEFVQIPESQPDPPPTDTRLDRTNRINYLGEVPDGSGRLYVPDLNGMIYLIEDGDPVEFLDVGAEFSPEFWNHQGLGSGSGFVAFHPEFADNGLFYTVHTEGRDALQNETPDLPGPDNPSHHGVLTEWIAEDPAASVFSGSRREMLRIGLQTFIHGFQQIGFNPTADPGDEDYGLLYTAIGDGGNAAFSDAPQDLGRPEGAIFRIDPLGDDSSNGQYGIPPSNPFADTPGALAETYAYGLRNPHRFSWDPLTQRMFVGNIGEWQIESIYEVRAGDNFGWSEREGPFMLGDDRWLYPLPDDDADYGYTYPVAAYDHNRLPGQTGDLGIAVVGGFVYRGAIPQLKGLYVFGDIVSGQMFFTRAGQMRRDSGELAPIQEFLLFNSDGERVTMQDLTGLDRIDLRFGQDADGELYVLSKGSGSIWKITDARRVPPRSLGQTVVDPMDERDWAAVTPDRWDFPGDEVILAEPGEPRPGPRRPFEYAILSAGPEWRTVEVEAQVRVDVPEPVGRDVVVVFGYQSDTRYYYAHLSEDDAAYPHNGIFLVNGADRERIDDQWDGSTGAPPAISPGMNWHDVRVTHNGHTGRIAVYADGSDEPLMTATDRTLSSGRVGFGSFDDVGRIRDLTVSGRPAPHGSVVIPEVAPNLVAHYDFDNPVADDPGSEQDLGISGTDLWLVNGGDEMRVDDGPFPRSARSLQTRQVNPVNPPSHEDWKAGVFDQDGVASLDAFNEVQGITIMGWFKQTGANPARNTNSADPDATFNAVGMAGVLSGDSEGHAVRALLEVISVDGELRLVALGRRLDGGASNTFAASEDWQTLFPRDEWAFLAATFDYDDGTMALYRNGEPLDGFYTNTGDPWDVSGPGPHATSATDPTGIKVGGSFPQNTGEQNPCDCRMDNLMFLDRVVTAEEVRKQYDAFR